MRFPNIIIEGKNYPSIIMGEDHFTGWFSKTDKNYKTEKLRAEAYYQTINTAYGLGVRGFSMSPHKTLIKVLGDFKKQHPDIVCIANPHFRQNYYLENESLWTLNNLNRLKATIAEKYKNQIKNIPWFKGIENYQVFSNEEIKKIYLNEEEYNKNLKGFSNFCDFSLIGNLDRSDLLLLGRQDLVNKESQLVRKQKMIPVLMCEAGVWGLEKSKGIDFSGLWIYMNEDFGIPDINSLIGYIKNIDKPITAYRAFTRSDGFNVEKTINFFKKIKQVKSLVVGIENALQAKDTFSKLNLR